MPMRMTRPRSLEVPSSRRKIKASPAVSLWKPDVVLATSIATAPARRAVVLAEPVTRPEALRTQLGATRSLLASLDAAREALGAVAANAQARAVDATTTRDRVSATF